MSEDDDLIRFPNMASAIPWFVGLRALSGTKKRECLCSLLYRLIEDGYAVLLSAETAPGKQYQCVAQLPAQMSEEEAEAGDFLGWVAGIERLRHAPAAGSA